MLSWRTFGGCSRRDAYAAHRLVTEGARSVETTRLPKQAYVIEEGETYVPLVREPSPAEFTIKAVVTGALLGMVFGAANTYLGLKAGLTISTSIPVAVLTVVVFRVLMAAGVGHGLLELWLLRESDHDRGRRKQRDRISVRRKQ